MAKPRGRERSKAKGKKGGAPTQRKRRPLLPLEDIDWKNFPSLRRFVSERGKIRSRRITGLSRRQQAQVAKAVKRARTMGLLIYPDQDRNVRH
jgi:small subunit ribosomal protein S18